jgi:23S rRNA pseudouridine2605 synthase
MDSEGLLLFTNDGEFANTMMHPKHEVNKTYHAWVVHFNDEALHKIKQPITLDGYRIRKPDVRLMGAKEDKALLEITIHEGRNRQVRRMCEAAGMHVTRLKRVGEGNLRLGELPLGKWRYLTEEEIRLLKAGK